MAHCVIQRNNCPSDPLKTLIPNWNNFKKPYSDTYFFQIILWQTLPLCRFLHIQNKPCPFLPGQCSALLSAWQPLLSETCTDSPSPVSLWFQARGCDDLEAGENRRDSAGAGNTATVHINARPIKKRWKALLDPQQQLNPPPAACTTGQHFPVPFWHMYHLSSDWDDLNVPCCSCAHLHWNV